jgi:flagellin-like protein
MSPNGQARGRKVYVSSNIYTAILAIAFFIVLAAAAFVAYTCYSQYGTIFKIP